VAYESELKGSGFRVQGLGFRVLVLGLGFWVESVGHGRRRGQGTRSCSAGIEAAWCSRNPSP
jgi:hypothetical protein